MKKLLTKPPDWRNTWIVSFILFLLFSLAAFKVSALPIPVALNVSPSPLGLGWEQNSTGGFPTTYSIDPIGEHSVSIFFDDDSTAVFDFQVIPNEQLLIPITLLSGGEFVPQFGTSGTLVALDSEPFYFLGNEVIDINVLVYDPSLFLYTYATGEELVLDASILPSMPPGKVPQPVTISLMMLGLVGIYLSHKRV